MGPMGLLMLGGTALGVPSVINAIDELTGDMFGWDWLGRRERQARIRGHQAVAQSLDDLDFHRSLSGEQDLAGWLGSMEGLRGASEDSPYRQVQDQRGLMSVLQREQQKLGEMAAIDTGPDFEALALQLGY